MNSKLISIFAVVIVVIAIGAFMLVGRQASAPSNIKTVPTTSNNVQKNSNNTAPTTLQSLLKSGISQKCTYSNELSGATSQGVFYINNGQARGDINVVSNKLTIKSHMIIDGQTTYIWSDSANKGTKVTMPAETANGAGSTPRQAVGNNEENYQCGPWTADASLFVPPANVTFSDAGNLAAPPSNSVLPTTTGAFPNKK